MDAAGYVSLTRQSGLMREMEAVANNIANASTTGFRREGVIFAEHVARLEAAPSLSMADARARHIDLSQGETSATGGTFDMAIQGDGFFLIETPQGERLTRAGAFMPNAEGELVNPYGHRLLDAGGAPIFVPPDAGPVGIGQDGTISADGIPLGRVGLWAAIDPLSLRHEGGTRFEAPGGVEPFEGGTILQGRLEGANVNPVSEIARMITVQRAYEMGQSLMDREHERIRSVIESLGR